MDVGLVMWALIAAELWLGVLWLCAVVTYG